MYDSGRDKKTTNKNKETGEKARHTTNEEEYKRKKTYKEVIEKNKVRDRSPKYTKQQPAYENGRMDTKHTIEKRRKKRES